MVLGKGRVLFVSNLIYARFGEVGNYPSGGALSITLLVGVVIGRLASISGAFFGAMFIQFIPNIADQISKAAPWAIYGVVLIAFMYAMPSGVAGLLRVARARWAGRQRPVSAIDPIPSITQRSET